MARGGLDLDVVEDRPGTSDVPVVEGADRGDEADDELGAFRTGPDARRQAEVGGLAVASRGDEARHVPQHGRRSHLGDDHLRRGCIGDGEEAEFAEPAGPRLPDEGLLQPLLVEISAEEVDDVLGDAGHEGEVRFDRHRLGRESAVGGAGGLRGEEEHRQPDGIGEPDEHVPVPGAAGEVEDVGEHLRIDRLGGLEMVDEGGDEMGEEA